MDEDNQKPAVTGTRFAIGEEVTIGPAGEVIGKVIGITIYDEEEKYHTQYCIRYLDRQTFLPCDGWFSERLLTA